MKEIAKKCPKAWDKFENFAIVDSELEADSFGYSDDYVDDINRLSLTTLSGYMFKFFDNQDIYIIVVYDKIAHDDFYLFRWCIRGYVVSKEEYHNRQEAEQAAFKKAFEILEKQLEAK